MFLKICWKHDTSLQLIGIHDSSAFYSTFLSFFVLEIFGFSWTSLFVRYFSSISRFEAICTAMNIQKCVCRSHSLVKKTSSYFLGVFDFSGGYKSHRFCRRSKIHRSSTSCVNLPLCYFKSDMNTFYSSPNWMFTLLENHFV